MTPDGNVEAAQEAGQHRTTDLSQSVEKQPLDLSLILYMQYLEIDGSIRQADLKAQVILGVSAVLITALTERTIGDMGLLFDASASPGARVVLVIKVAVMLLLLMAVFFSILAVLPRFKRSRAGSALFFFSDIITQTEHGFITWYNGMSTNQVRNAVISQIHAKSFIVDAKFRRVRSGLLVLVIAIILWGVQYVIPV